MMKSGNKIGTILIMLILVAQFSLADDFAVRESSNNAAYFFVDGTDGYVGIGMETPGQPLDVDGNIRTNSQFVSTVLTGSSPFVISSSTKVNNLNSDLLDGHSSEYFMVATTDNWVDESGDTMSGTLNMGNNALTNIDWSTSDDGSGSGLDSDLLDGHSSEYFMIATTDNWVDESGDTMSGTLNMGNNALTNIDWSTSDDGSGSGLDADRLDNIDSGSFFILSQSETVTGIPAFNGGVTGTSAPFTVDSTYKVTNLNADLLDGHDSSHFMTSVTDNWVDITGDTMTGDLRLSGGITPTIFFDSSATGDMAIRANAEAFEIFEPEDTNKVHLRVIDDNGVNAVLGLRTGAGDGTVRISNTGYGSLSGLSVSDGLITGANSEYLQIGATNGQIKGALSDGDYFLLTTTSFDLSGVTLPGDDIQDGTIDSSEIQDNTLTADDLAPDSVTSSEIATNAVGASEIVTSAVESAEIKDGTVQEVDLEVTNTPTNNYILSYDSTTGGFTWIVDDVVDADSSTTNEIQTLGTSANTITLTNGGSVTAPYSLNSDKLDNIDSGSFFILSQSETVTGIPAFNGGVTGTSAPFTVDSTYKVTNLNADLFDGRNSDDFIDDDGDTMYGDLNINNNALTNIDWSTSDDGSGSGLDADKLDGLDSTQFITANEFKDFGTHTFSSSTTTEDFISELETMGMFDNYHSVVKGTWNYAGNSDISDTGFGTFELAGTIIETWTDNADDTVRGNIHVRVTRPTTGSSSGQILVYNDQGPTYSPGWRQIWTSTTDGSGSGLDSDLLDGQEGSYYLDNTDTQDLGTSGNTITLTDGGSVTAPYATNAGDSDLLDGQDGSYYLDNTDTQDLGVSGDTITLTDGGSITVPFATNANTLDSYNTATAYTSSSVIYVSGTDGYLPEVIDAGSITAGAVGTSQVADNSLTASDLAQNSVGNSELFDGGDWIITSSLNIGTNGQALSISPDGYLSDEDDNVYVNDDLTVAGGKIVGANSEYLQVGETNGQIKGVLSDGDYFLLTTTSFDLSGVTLPGDDIQDGTIDSSEIQDNTLTASDLAENSVGNSELINTGTFEMAALKTDSIEDTGSTERISFSSGNVIITLG